MSSPLSPELTATITRRHLTRGSQEGAATDKVTRWLFVTGVVLYMGWHPIMRWLFPEGTEPFHERALVGMVCMVLMALSMVDSLRHRLELFVAIAIYVGTFHHLTLTTRNDLAPPYLISAFIVIGALGPLFPSLRSGAFYAGFAMATSTGAALLSNGSTRDKGILVVGVFTLEIIAILGLWRNHTLHRETQAQIKRAGRLFRNLLDVLPDPVYARLLEGGDFRVTNEAFDRSLQSSAQEISGTNLAQREVVSALARSEALALATGHTIERDVAFVGLDGARHVVSLKVAAPRLKSGQRAIVGMVRDVTDSRNLEASLKAKIDELEAARSEVRRLQGLLPICMHCGQIRQDDGSWQDLTQYVQQHSDAEFSHGVCETCLDKLYPEKGARHRH